MFVLKSDPRESHLIQVSSGIWISLLVSFIFNDRMMMITISMGQTTNNPKTPNVKKEGGIAYVQRNTSIQIIDQSTRSVHYYYYY